MDERLLSGFVLKSWDTAQTGPIIYRMFSQELNNYDRVCGETMTTSPGVAQTCGETVDCEQQGTSQTGVLILTRA